MIPRCVLALALALILAGCAVPGPPAPCWMDSIRWACHDSIPDQAGCYFHEGKLSCPLD